MLSSRFFSELVVFSRQRKRTIDLETVVLQISVLLSRIEQVEGVFSLSKKEHEGFCYIAYLLEMIEKPLLNFK